MLLIWSAGLHAFCVESQLLHSPLNGRTSGSFASTANPQMFALAREHADRTGRETVMFSTFYVLRSRLPGLSGHRSLMNWQWDLVLK